MGVEILAFFCPIIWWNMGFPQQFKFSMGECTFWSKLARFVHFPITAHFCFKFLLEIVLSCDDQPGFYGFDLLRSRYCSWLFKFGIIIIFVSIELRASIVRMVIAVAGESLETVIIISGAPHVPLARLACTALVGGGHRGHRVSMLRLGQIWGEV